MCFGKDKSDEKREPLIGGATGTPTSLRPGVGSVQHSGYNTNVVHSAAASAAPVQQDMETSAIPFSWTAAEDDSVAHTDNSAVTHRSSAGIDTNPGVFSPPVSAPKDEKASLSSDSEAEEALAVPVAAPKSKSDILEEAIPSDDHSTFSSLLREDHALINLDGLYSRIATSPNLLFAAFNFLSTADHCDDGRFYTDFQEAQNYSGRETYGRSKPKGADAMKFNLENPFHKFTWHMIITKLRAPIQEAAIKYLIKFHPDLYNSETFQPQSALKIAPLAQLVLHNLAGVVKGIAESGITFESSLKAAQDKITDKTSEDIIAFLDPESLPKKFYTLASADPKAANYAQIYKMLLNSTYFETKIAALQEAFPSIFEEISKIIEDSGSVSAELKTKYSTNPNYSLLTSCYSIMKQAKGLSKKFAFVAEDVNEKWFVIGDDAMTVATRRTAGSVYSTAEFGEGDTESHFGAGGGDDYPSVAPEDMAGSMTDSGGFGAAGLMGNSDAVLHPN